MAAHEKVVLVTKKTQLEELIERFNTHDQARFYIEHMGGDFDAYEDAHNVYGEALRQFRASIPGGVRSQVIERGFLPTFTFGAQDLIVTLGPDGLVVNTAKYLDNQPLLALNPDPARIDGVLIPFTIDAAPKLLESVCAGHYTTTPVSMARASLNDGQTLYAVNDLFIGQRTHVSARYTLRLAGQEERQSSSGILVSTGAGSTGWFRSVLAGAAGVVESMQSGVDTTQLRHGFARPWETDQLWFSVREPFPSVVSSVGMIFGPIEPGQALEIESQMPQNGVIFSDGVEADYLDFNSGAIASIGLADRKMHLVQRL